MKLSEVVAKAEWTVSLFGKDDPSADMARAVLELAPIVEELAREECRDWDQCDPRWEKPLDWAPTEACPPCRARAVVGGAP